jgi:precorrin-2 dehydrogenase / sirohydrochlorin ferrochelatase
MRRETAPRGVTGRYLPVLIDLKYYPVLIIGGGRVAERKVLTLIRAGASIRLVSPTITARLSALVRRGTIERVPRRFRFGDLKRAALVYVCTSDASVSRLIGSWAKREGKLVNLADLPEQSSFFVPATVNRGDLMIAISTCGKSPALARKVRIELAERFGEEYGDLLRILGAVRRRLLERPDGSTSQRAVIFRRLVDSDLLNLLRNRRSRKAQELVRRLTGIRDLAISSLIRSRRKG